MSTQAEIQRATVGSAVAPRARGRGLRFLSPRFHGVIDYAAAAGLIVLPFVLGLGRTESPEVLLSVGAGLLLAVYSALTDYRYGLARAVSFPRHLAFDSVAGAGFVAAPFALGFDPLATAYYVANGLAVLTVVAVSNPALAED